MAMLAASLVLGAGAFAQTVEQNLAARDEKLKKFLRNYESKGSSPAEKSTRYAAVFVPLKGFGTVQTEQAIVYLLGPRWCGSGGCSCLILEPSGSSFKVITRTTVTQLPILVLEDTPNGWSDQGVGVGGGGIQPYEASLKFNGKKYPSNPTVPPALKIRGKKPPGIVVIPVEPKWTERW